MQGVLFNEIGAHSRQIAFGQLAQSLKKQVSHGKVEHRVAQKLQPLIVVCGETAVRDGQRQQIGVREVVLQTTLQRIKNRLHAYLELERPLYLSSR